MATLNLPQDGKAIKGRSRKSIPIVDLTAMVDLAFLLITFFMLTTSLAKVAQMDVAKPVLSPEPSSWPESRTMTILLGKNHEAVYFMGDPARTKIATVRLDRIKVPLLANKHLVEKSHALPTEKRMLVIIKPTNTSVYKDLVDILDEMNINGIETYAIDDKHILDREKAFLIAKGI